MSKRLVESFLKISDKIKTSVVKGNINQPIAETKWELKVEGEFKDMSNNQGFNKKQLEQIAQIVVSVVKPMIQPIIDDVKELKHFAKEQREFNQRIEQDIKDVKFCPTIRKELK